MALKKQIQARAGFMLEYWRIGDWRISMQHKIMDICLIPYLSSKTRVDGLEPVNEEIRKIRIFDAVNKIDAARSIYGFSEHFSPEALEAAGIDIYKIMYQYIKDHVPEFDGAMDV